MTAVLRWLADAGSEPGPEAADVRRALSPASRRDLALALVHAWLAAGAPGREGWVLAATATLAPELAGEPLGRLVDGWAREGRARRAVLAIDALERMDADGAVFALQRIAARTPSPSVQERAGEALEAIAAARQVLPEELEEQVLPDLGLDSAARVTLDYGGRTFVGAFDARSKAVVRDERGRPLARLPPAGRADDPQKAALALERWRELRAAGEFVLGRQAARFESAMCRRRAWTAEAFVRLARHPLVAQLAKRLVFEACGMADGRWQMAGTATATATFRIAEDWTLADVRDREWVLPPDSLVRVPHPIGMDAATIAAWDALLADYEIVPPFAQMQRQVYRPTEREAGASEITRVAGRPTSMAKLYGLRHRGWSGMIDEGGTLLTKVLDDGSGAAFLDVGDGALGSARVRTEGGGKLRLGALDPIVFSELVRDLEWAAL